MLFIRTTKITELGAGKRNETFSDLFQEPGLISGNFRDYRVIRRLTDI